MDGQLARFLNGQPANRVFGFGARVNCEMVMMVMMMWSNGDDSDDDVKQWWWWWWWWSNGDDEVKQWWWWWWWSEAMIGVHCAQTELLCTTQTLSTLGPVIITITIVIISTFIIIIIETTITMENSLNGATLVPLIFPFLAFADKSAPSVTICLRK